jgi:integrase
MPLAKQKSSKNWYVRRAVPRDLRKIIGKYEVWESTKTSDKQVARRRSRKIEAKIDLVFERARAVRSPTAVDRVPDDQLVRLAREVFKATLAEYDDSIALGHDLEGLDVQLGDLSVGLEYDSWDRDFLDEVREKLLRAGFEVSDGPGFSKAVRLIARAMGAALTTAQMQAAGHWDFVASDALVTGAPTDVPEVDAGISIRDLIHRFEHDPSRAHVTDKSKRQYDTVMAILMEVVGETSPASQVNREDCRLVREKLLARNLATTTINSYLTGLSALFEYAIREQLLDKNPARGLSIKTGPHGRDLRKPYSDSQLRRIFTSPEWRSCKTKQPSLYWCPLLSILMGLRLTEAGQLLREDVKNFNGTWAITIEPSVTKRVKSRAGRRVVPVHPKLVDLGFLDYVRSVNTERLFDDLPEPTRGYTEALGKRWRRLVRRLNADEERTSYHSLRHSWADACRAAKVSEGIMKQAGGWASGGGASGLYGHGYDLETLQKELEGIEPLPGGIL